MIARLAILLLALTCVNALSARERLLGKDSLVLGAIDSESSGNQGSVSASPSSSSSGMDADPPGSPAGESSITQTATGTQVRRHVQNVQQLRNKRGGRMYVISNRNSLVHQGLLDPAKDGYTHQEQSTKAVNEEHYKASKDDIQDEADEQRTKRLRADESKEKQANEQKRKKTEQAKLSMNYILRKEWGVIQPSKGKIVVSNEHIRESLRFTYMFWIKPTGKVPFWGNILHKGDASNQRSPAVYFYPDSTRLHIRSATPNADNDGANPDPEAQLQIEAWSHVAFAHAEGLFVVYVNGKEVSKTTNIGRPKLNSGNLYASFDNPALVDLADIRYYPRVATPDEVAEVKSQQRYRQ